MKKKKLSKISLGKHKIANFKTAHHLIGGDENTTTLRLCPYYDDKVTTAGGGGGGGGSMTLNWMCNQTASVCGQTQVTCACG